MRAYDTNDHKQTAARWPGSARSPPSRRGTPLRMAPPTATRPPLNVNPRRRCATGVSSILCESDQQLNKTGTMMLQAQEPTGSSARPERDRHHEGRRTRGHIPGDAPVRRRHLRTARRRSAKRDSQSSESGDTLVEVLWPSSSSASVRWRCSSGSLPPSRRPPRTASWPPRTRRSVPPRTRSSRRSRTPRTMHSRRAPPRTRPPGTSPDRSRSPAPPCSIGTAATARSRARVLRRQVRRQPPSPPTRRSGRSQSVPVVHHDCQHRHLRPAAADADSRHNASQARVPAADDGQPGTGTINGAGQPAADHRRRGHANNIVYSDASSVTLTATGPGSLSSNCSGVENNGIFSFSNCSFNAVGTYTVTATDSNRGVQLGVGQLHESRRRPRQRSRSRPPPSRAWRPPAPPWARSPSR